MENFEKNFNALKSFTIVAKLSILDIYGGPNYSSVTD